MAGVPVVPEDCKSLVPFLQRAGELDAREPVIAYYCRLHVVKQGLTKRTPQNKAAVEAFLSTVMGKLEEIKRSLPDPTPVTDERIGREYLRNFALKVFLKADNEDRRQDVPATGKTARTFLAAAVFFESMNAFGDLEPDVAEKVKYCKWRATEILRAEKEGRPPAPPPSNDEDAFPSQPPFSDAPTPPSASSAPAPAAPPAAAPFQPPAGGVALPFAALPSPYAAYSAAPPAVPVTSPPMAAHGAMHDDDFVSPRYDPKLIALAQKYARFAISALQYDDIPTAKAELHKALDELTRAEQGERKR